MDTDSLLTLSHPQPQLLEKLDTMTQIIKPKKISAYRVTDQFVFWIVSTYKLKG